MKRLSIFILAAVAISATVACSGKKVTETWQEALSRLDAYVEELEANDSISTDELIQLYYAESEKIYREHPADSAGLRVFKGLITNFWEAEDALKEYEKASELIRSDELISTKIEALRNADAGKVGDEYIDICGTDILTGEPLSISSMLALGKPLIVDFWASWCSPCKKEIKESLVPLAEKGEYNILGIAVWENSSDDTLEKMKTLGVSWPVMYTGGRVGSPSIQYGVIGIPTMILISPDGTILGRGHSVQDLFNQ